MDSDSDGIYQEDEDAEQLEIEMQLERDREERERKQSAMVSKGPLLAVNTGKLLAGKTYTRSEAKRNAAGEVLRSDLATHISLESCWVVIRGKVWDITAFLDTHPGGPQAVLDFAGMDATVPITTMHPPEIMEQLPEDFCLGPVEAAAAPTTLHEAVQSGERSAVEALLAARADVHAVDALGRTCLHIAAENGSSRLVKFLLITGAAVGTRDHGGQTPEELARDRGHSEIQALLASKA